MSKPMYYVYHVPGIKVGMTKDLGDRVFEQQGYDPHEVELLYVSRDMEAASKKELEYQQKLQYPIDRQSYKEKKKVKFKGSVNLPRLSLKKQIHL
jgi:hypothetical protein